MMVPDDMAAKMIMYNCFSDDVPSVLSIASTIKIPIGDIAAKIVLNIHKIGFARLIGRNCGFAFGCDELVRTV